ncbi:MAG TPA: DsbA family protein [Xanthobacteraceae bacterium]|jgi:protein-disulfide isomerase|nr:DsbA family protein [Xanthobacteraceae bacterium]
MSPVSRILSRIAVSFMLFAAFPASGAFAQAAGDGDPLTRERVLRDPDIPAAGNPNGDITIVEFFDYQCPYCRTIHPELKKAVEADGKVRVIYKNWPIFGGVSTFAARLVLAAKYQNKYTEAHEALITASTKLDELRVLDLLEHAGIDVKRAQNDLEKNAKSIDAALARSRDQALAFGFQGTPSFIFNTFRYAGMLDAEGFKAAFTDARNARDKTRKKASSTK